MTQHEKLLGTFRVLRSIRRPKFRLAKRCKHTVSQSSQNNLTGALSLLSYVHPRSRKIKSKTGIGILRSHNKIYLVAAVPWICVLSASYSSEKKSVSTNKLRI